MNLEPPKAEIKSATRVTGGPATPRKGPPKFKQRQTRQFKSKPPKKGIQGYASIKAPTNSDVADLGDQCVISVVLSALEMTSLAWRAWVQISPSSAPGRPSITWSCTSWPSTASSEPSHYGPCTFNHLPQAPSQTSKWNCNKQKNKIPNCNEHKNGKKRKKGPKKKKYISCCSLTLDSLLLAVTQHLLL
uniref:Retinal rod rhodopsin-sensitive cGMP 3',5'-cyclic phosphodiesterase subunit gamma n=1 Tax=Fundulus heteroclitus TaxID=8078 RepID=A0A3Q2PCZ5_FUNHE